MAPEKGARKEELDERLIEARDEVLLPGENVVAEESGDPGQAVVLTDSRIIILRAGITATGMLNGRRTGAYPVSQITDVSLRKGPMGCVLQVCGEGVGASPDERPESIVVFSGPDKVKCCEAIADRIEKMIGKAVERIEPKSAPESVPASESSEAVSVAEPIAESVTEPVATASAPASEPVVEVAKPKERKSRGGRVAKSLAEEMFEECTPSESVPHRPADQPVYASQAAPEVTVPETVPQPVAEMPEVAPPPQVVEDIMQAGPEATEQHNVTEDAEPESEDEPNAALDSGFRPNPNLPKPVRRKSRGSGKSVVLIGGLMAVLLMGIAITAPLREQNSKPVAEVNIAKLTNNATVLRRQFIDVSSYRAKTVEIIKASDSSIAAVRSAVSSQNPQVIQSALRNDATDSAWTELSGTKAPAGLAEARERLVSGLFIRKSAVEGAMTGTVSAADTLRKLADADRQIAAGFEVIDRMLRDLESRMPNTTAKGQ